MAIDGCTITDTLRQGIVVDRSHDVLLTDVDVAQSGREGVLLTQSAGTVVHRVTVSGARSRDGIAVLRSPDTAIASCTATGNLRGGIHVRDADRLTVVDNHADENAHVGLRVERSFPIRSTDDLVAGGNTAHGNGTRDLDVTPPPCRRRPCDDATSSTTTTTRPGSTTTHPATSSTSTTRTPTTTTSTSTLVLTTTTSTTTSMTTTTGPLVTLHWRFYVRMTLAQGGLRNVDVPYRSIEPPLAIGIQPSHESTFRIGVRVYESDIAALGGDTLARLTSGVTDYIKAHPRDYPGFTGIESLRWAMRKS